LGDLTSINEVDSDLPKSHHLQTFSVVVDDGEFFSIVASIIYLIIRFPPSILAMPSFVNPTTSDGSLA